MIDFKFDISEFIAKLKLITELSFRVQVSFGRTAHIWIVGNTFTIVFTPVFDFVEGEPYCVMVSEYTHLHNSVTEYGIPLFREIQHLSAESVYVLKEVLNKK